MSVHTEQSEGEIRMTNDELVWTRACEAGHCLEVARAGDEILIRNNRQPDQIISCDRQELAQFVEALANGVVAV